MKDKNAKPSRKKFARVKPEVNFTLLTNEQIREAIKHHDNPDSVKKSHKKPK